MSKPNSPKPERNPIRVLTFNAAKPALRPADTSLDTLADSIRKAWIQNKPKAS